MRTGDAQRGFTYLLLLFVVAAAGIASAAWSRAWTTAAQREREIEWQARGHELARALGSWRAAGDGSGPQELADLLDDTRAGPLRRHLRRVPDDPLTGRPDWVLVRDAQGGIVAVHSRSEAVLLLTRDLPAATDVQTPRARDVAFAADVPAGAPAAAPTEEALVHP